MRVVDPEIVEFARSYRALADAVYRIAPEEDELSEVGRHVQAFLGVPLTEVEPVSETFPPHQVVDLDLALEALVSEYAGTWRGISGNHRQPRRLLQRVPQRGDAVQSRRGRVRAPPDRTGQRPAGGRLRPG